MKKLSTLLAFSALLALSAGASTTINYTISGTSGDWTGTFVVNDTSVAISGDKSLSLTALYSSTTYSFDVDYFGSNNTGYLSWSGSLYNTFKIYSSDLYSYIHSDGTWAGLDDTTYNLNASSSLTFSSDEGNLSSTASATLGESTITFSIVPEPATYGSMAGLGALGLAFFARRRKKA